MPDYSKGQIYTVRCYDDISLIYVGSTIDSLSKRFNSHKSDNNVSLFKYVNEFYDGDWDNWYIELYELYPCNSKQELNRREGEVQREIATINKNIAGRTKKEYYQENADERKQYSKEHYINNIEKRTEQMKHYKEENIEKIKENNQQYAKKKYQENVDKFKDKNTEYYQNNAEKIKKQKQLYYLKKKQEKEASIIN